MGEQIWVIIGIFLGVVAGVLGAYAGWFRVNNPPGTGLPSWVAGATLVLALSLGAVAVCVHPVGIYRALLLAPPAILGCWFVIQVRAVRSGAKRKSRSRQEGCHRK